MLEGRQGRYGGEVQSPLEKKEGKFNLIGKNRRPTTTAKKEKKLRPGRRGGKKT